MPEILGVTPMRLSKEERAALSVILTKEEPLGPIVAEKLSDTAFKLLFSRENDIVHGIRPTNLLIGRRGAGKTSFLNYLRLNHSERLTVVLGPQNVFPEVLKSIQRIFPDGETNPETVAKLWEILTWSALFSVMVWSDRSENPSLVHLAHYLSRFGIKRGAQPDRVIHSIAKALEGRVRNGESADSPLQLLNLVRFNNASYEQSLETAQKILRARDWLNSRGRAVILMDTLENFRIDTATVKGAFSGLLKFVGAQSVEDLVDVHFCVPAEIYPSIVDASTNTMKDFESNTFLHWKAGDLVQIAARRLLLYLQIHDEAKFEDYAARHQVDRRAGAVALWREVLPESVENRLGAKEPPLAHILRHTQLLPRHLLYILNSIVSSAVDHGGKLGRLDERLITSSVIKCEHLLRSDLPKAYKNVYPLAERLCNDVVPHLPRRFQYGFLQRTFNEHAGTLLKQQSRSVQDVSEFPMFKQMLIDIGVIGKVIGETEIYAEAEFDYHHPGQLQILEDEEICLHPVFSGKNFRRKGNDVKFIYPYGSDPSAESD